MRPSLVCRAVAVVYRLFSLSLAYFTSLNCFILQRDMSGTVLYAFVLMTDLQMYVCVSHSITIFFRIAVGTAILSKAKHKTTFFFRSISLALSPSVALTRKINVRNLSEIYIF